MMSMSHLRDVYIGKIQQRDYLSQEESFQLEDENSQKTANDRLALPFRASSQIQSSSTETDCRYNWSMGHT